MNIRRFAHYAKPLVLVTLLAGFAGTQLSACNGIPLPPIPVTVNLLVDATIDSNAGLDGAAQVNLGAFCDLFTEEELDAMIRAAAGDLIADVATLTSVELAATNIMVTTGTFDPFTTAELTVDITGSSADPLLLGTAADNDGLGTSFTLTQNTPVDLLNDIQDGECGTAVLRVEGADALTAAEATFDVSVDLLVYITVNTQ